MAKLHMSLSIRGALSNMTKRELGRMLTDDNGNSVSADDAKQFLMDCLEEGKKYLPIGDCPTFDYQYGCQCHKIKQEATDEAKN